MQNRDHVVLVGPMGSGKSTLGRALAARLARPFVDVDARIEADAGCSIAALFAAEGEAGFRAREARVLAAVLGGPAAVIATGGGAVLAEANRTAMRAAGVVVYLGCDLVDARQWMHDDHVCFGQRHFVHREDEVVF